MFICTLDGLEMRKFETEQEAIDWCLLYDGDHEVQYEYVKD